MKKIGDVIGLGVGMSEEMRERMLVELRKRLKRLYWRWRKARERGDPRAASFKRKYVDFHIIVRDFSRTKVDPETGELVIEVPGGMGQACTATGPH